MYNRHVANWRTSDADAGKSLDTAPNLLEREGLVEYSVQTAKAIRMKAEEEAAEIREAARKEAAALLQTAERDAEVEALVMRMRVQREQKNTQIDAQQLPDGCFKLATKNGETLKGWKESTLAPICRWDVGAGKRGPIAQEAARLHASVANDLRVHAGARLECVDDGTNPSAKKAPAAVDKGAFAPTSQVWNTGREALAVPLEPRQVRGRSVVDSAHAHEQVSSMLK